MTIPRIIPLLLLCLVACGCTSADKKPAKATRAPSPVTSIEVLDLVDPPTAPQTGSEAPQMLILTENGHTTQYEPVWQVLGDVKGKKGEGRWVYRKVSERPQNNPNLQPGLLEQELGVITAESMRLNQQLVTQLQQLALDADSTKREVAKIGQKVIEMDAARKKAAAAPAVEAEQPAPQSK